MNNYDRDLQKLYIKCEKLVSYHVVLQLDDGCMLDGIVEDVDVDSIAILIGEDVLEKEYDRNRPRRRYRRFRRRRFPLASLAAISLLAYPYYYPY